MSSLLETVANTVELTDTETVPSDPALLLHKTGDWQSHFAEEQIRLLIQQVFVPGLQTSSHHVVFCAVDESTDSAGVCADVALAMPRYVAGTVCLVEASPAADVLEMKLGLRREFVHWPQRAGRNSGEGERIAENLWLINHQLLKTTFLSVVPTIYLRERLNELRNKFDFVVIHAAAVGTSSETAMLAQLCDGVILVLDAHRTRRAVASKAQELLQTANVRILGTVLNGRTFPIPETLYRKL
jgi:hypothetical protein